MATINANIRGSALNTIMSIVHGTSAIEDSPSDDSVDFLLRVMHAWKLICLVATLPNVNKVSNHPKTYQTITFFR